MEQLSLVSCEVPIC